MLLNPILVKEIKRKMEALAKLRPLSPALVGRLRDQVIVEWTYNSNAIEGTKLSLRETELILEQGLTIKGIPLCDHFEAVNHKEAIIFLEEMISRKKTKINCLFVRQIHQLILKNIDQGNAGKYREVQVKIGGSNYLPPSPLDVPLKMRQFESWLRNKKIQRDLVDYAALAHFKLVDIHPFVDGNGRTARLIMNLILMAKGYPPTVILKTDRAKYYQTLDLAHRGKLEPFIDFIGQCVDRSLTWYLDAVTPEKKKKVEDKWQLLSVLALKTKYSQEYLSLLARRNKIAAVKKGRNWYSNLDAIREYTGKL